MKSKQTLFYIQMMLCLFITNEAFGQQFVKDLKVTKEQLQIQFEKEAPSSYILEIGGPSSYYWRDAVSERPEIVFNNIRANGEKFIDGQYTLQITPVYVLSEEDNKKMREYRDANNQEGVAAMQQKYNIPLKSDFYHYNFRIQRGEFVIPETHEARIKTPSIADKSELKLQNQGLYATLDNKVLYDVAFTGKTWQSKFNMDDQVILDDLIVAGSICAGQDCDNGESFGFDTFRLKENNLRIKFQDTSASASFPSNDWQITANDSSNGGLNKFSIDDIDGGRTPFTIEASAPSHSLYVDDAGRVGFGTATPVTEQHVVDGDTPTLRLEQNGSSGFGAQTWDLGSNETNFFIRDATNGSTLPFKIRPGAPTGSVDIEADGSLKFGDYGAGNNVGTATYLLGVDAAGNLTEEAVSSGGGSGSSVWAQSGADISYVTGNVGIGTTSPSDLFEINKTIDGNVRFSVINEDGGSSATTGFRLLTTNGNSAFAFQHFAGSYAGTWDGFNLANATRMRNSSAGSGIILATNTAVPLMFGVGDVEKMRVHSNGNVGIGTKDPSHALEVCGSIGTTSASVTVGITCSSDARFKKNVTTLESSLSNILQLRGVNYEWRINEFPQKHFNEGNQIGFIAQEIETILPDVVKTDKEGYKSVDYSRLTPVLVEAVKEQNEVIEAQQSEIELLKAELAELRTLKAQVAELSQLIKKENSSAENSQLGEDD